MDLTSILNHRDDDSNSGASVASTPETDSRSSSSIDSSSSNTTSLSTPLEESSAAFSFETQYPVYRSISPIAHTYNQISDKLKPIFETSNQIPPISFQQQHQQHQQHQQQHQQQQQRQQHHQQHQQQQIAPYNPAYHHNYPEYRVQPPPRYSHFSQGYGFGVYSLPPGTHPSSLNSSNNLKQYACSTCSKRFARKSDLVRHERIHTGVRPNICTVCGKQFIQRSALTVHMRVHTGEKPHKCDICQKAFSDSSSLARHRRVHTGKRPYICDYPGCNKTFTRRTTLTRHINSHCGWSAVIAISPEHRSVYAVTAEDHTRQESGNYWYQPKPDYSSYSNYNPTESLPRVIPEDIRYGQSPLHPHYLAAHPHTASASVPTK